MIPTVIRRTVRLLIFIFIKSEPDTQQSALDRMVQVR